MPSVCYKKKIGKYSNSPLSTGDPFQEPWWIPETMDNTKPYIYYIFSYTYIPMINFNLWIRDSKRWTTITNNKIEQS